MPVPNVIKYSPSSTSTGCIRKGNVGAGVANIEYGPTSSTGFWNGITPNANGYTVYKTESTGSPWIMLADDTTQLIGIAIQEGANSALVYTEALALDWFAGQSKYMVMNADYEAIVTDGLIMLTDAGCAASATMSGLTPLYDLSGNSYNGTFTGGLYPSVGSPRKTSFYGLYYGYGTYVNFGTVASAKYVNGSNFTLETWCYPVTGSGNSGAILQWYGPPSPTAGGYAMYLANNGANYTLQFAKSRVANTASSAAVTGNAWSQCVVTAALNGSSGVIKHYVNGSLQFTKTAWQYNPSAGDYTNNYQIGRSTTDGTIYDFNGRMSINMNYNRVLSDAEVLQNFNALRGRYGI